MRLLELMNPVFNLADVSVHALRNDHKTTLTTPILSFTHESRVIEDDNGRYIEFGRDMVGGVRPRIHLGNFKIDELNGKFLNNEQLAFALAFLASHEVGHSYKLNHLDQSNNVMRSRVVLDNEATGPRGNVIADDIIKGLLRPCSFTQG